MRETGLIGAFETGTWTLFAPTNQAFVSLPRGYLDFLDGDLAALSNFLLLHAAPDQILSKDDLPCVAGKNLIEMATTKGTYVVVLREWCFGVVERCLLNKQPFVRFCFYKTCV